MCPAFSIPETLLITLFSEINQAYFDGFLDVPDLQWNSRLRSSAGRFIPGKRKDLRRFSPKIEIASYLTQQQNASKLIYDTLAHEMIHYWLWVRERPHGHTSQFLAKMRDMGVSRYNPVPRLRANRYLYQCKACGKQFPSHVKLGVLACADCCNLLSSGKYDPRFKLESKEFL